MAQLIQFKRRIPGTGAPPSGTGVGQVTVGEPAVSISALGATGVADMYVGDGTYVHTLVSHTRQVELAGPQTITGVKTIAPAALHLTGGNAGEFLTTDGAGNVSWDDVPAGVHVGPTAPVTPAPVAGDMWYNTTTQQLMTFNGTVWEPSGARVHTGATQPTGTTHTVGDIWLGSNGPEYWNGTAWVAINLGASALEDLEIKAPLEGDGLTALTALGVTPATTALIDAHSDNVYPITSGRLWSQIIGGTNSVASLTTTNKLIVPAINELVTSIAGVSGAVRFIGSYDVPNDEVGTGAGSPIPDGDQLPPAAPANEGWYFIVSDPGTGINNAPPVLMAAGDWVVSTGSAWVHVPLHHAAVVASAVAITAIGTPPESWANVQTALAGLYAQLHTAGSAAVLADHVSVLGDGTSATASVTAGLLRVGTVDGGTY